MLAFMLTGPVTPADVNPSQRMFLSDRFLRDFFREASEVNMLFAFTFPFR